MICGFSLSQVAHFHHKCFVMTKERTRGWRGLGGGRREEAAEDERLKIGWHLRGFEHSLIVEDKMPPFSSFPTRFPPNAESTQSQKLSL